MILNKQKNKFKLRFCSLNTNSLDEFFFGGGGCLGGRSPHAPLQQEEGILVVILYMEYECICTYHSKVITKKERIGTTYMHNLKPFFEGGGGLKISPQR